MSQLSADDQSKLVISAIAVVPYLVIMTLMLIPLYVANKKPLLGAKWKDALLWVGSVVAFYGLSFGFMYIPWPIPESED